MMTGMMKIFQITMSCKEEKCYKGLPRERERNSAVERRPPWFWLFSPSLLLKPHTSHRKIIYHQREVETEETRVTRTAQAARLRFLCKGS